MGAAIANDTFHPGRSAAEHLAVLATAAGVGPQRVDAVLEAVGLSDVARRKVGAFSLGMRQRLTIATAILGDPSVLVLDEPLNGLDPDGILWFRAMVHDFAAAGGTVLLSSHLLVEVSQTVDDAVIIDHGRLLAAGPLHELGGVPVTVVHSEHADHLAAALLATGYPARRTSADEIQIPGVASEAIGLVAAREGVVITGLYERAADLEATFQHLTKPQGSQR